jgi:hypothetical protein
MAEKSSWAPGKQTAENLVWFGEIERKLAKLSKTTFTYRSSSYLFYGSKQAVILCLFLLVDLFGGAPHFRLGFRLAQASSRDPNSAGRDLFWFGLLRRWT